MLFMCWSASPSIMQCNGMGCNASLDDDDGGGGDDDAFKVSHWVTDAPIVVCLLAYSPSQPASAL